MKKTPLIILIIVIIAAIVYVYVRNHTSNGPTKESVTTPRAALTFDQVSNAAVPAPWEDTQMITLKKGTYDEKDGSVDMLTEATSYVSTDLNDDGDLDMLAITAGNSGGTGYFYDLLAFINDNGSPKYMGKLELGDRIKVNKISADKNVVTVDIVTQGPDDGLCCATLKQVKTYTFEGNEFVENK